MSRRRTLVATCVSAAALAALAASIAWAQPAKEGAPKPAPQPEMKLPPGWTAADMQACIDAGTPGKMQGVLTRDAGVWKGKGTMWMGPGSDSMAAEFTLNIKPAMDGRFVTFTFEGDMADMGPFNGLGINGFDNVEQKFVSSWIDNQSTGILSGTGELSPDGSTLTWTYRYTCPVTRKPAMLRQIERRTGENTKLQETFGTDPKSGKEYKMMSFEFKRVPA